MSQVDRIAFGKFVREIRLEKKLRQSDLIDDFLSQPVLSNIESGKGQVSEDKMRYVLKKLGIEEELSKFYLDRKEKKEEEEANEELHISLIAVENTIDLVGADKGLEELRELSVPYKHPFQVILAYLKAKGYFKKKNWKKAYNYFFNGIHLIDKHYPGMRTSNIKSACYHDLSTIEYRQNRLHQALIYADEALKHFVKDGDRQYLKDLILISKVIYLEKLNRVGDAQTILDEIASSGTSAQLVYGSESKEASLNMYEMEAKLLAKAKRYPQAVKFALKGIELARIDRMYERSLELWTTLGSIFIETGKIHLAQCCFRTALNLKKKIKREYLLAYVYSQLGMLYYIQEDIKNAEKEFSFSLEYSRKTNDIYLEIVALTGLGKCLMKNGQRDQALSTLNEALKLADRHTFLDKKNELLMILANYLKNIGDPNFKNYALDFFSSYVETLEGGVDDMNGNVSFQPIKRHAAGDPPNS
ncbi:helix-turn-helix domain-containing protein [Thermoactinomyces mirandus]|uniref:Tetratricopeptide repeat protein n=1 Tax=Thermoactinomyces mirandus TaxID=2756294 RepID=A0A7W1XRE5_9BACL|nr:tetratricopeptide repeat protein [Thermoactinomyces mirandus]MBA4601736.1 tetratricopeptide repeat protein [Thermoactinomyces mirandus]